MMESGDERVQVSENNLNPDNSTNLSQESSPVSQNNQSTGQGIPKNFNIYEFLSLMLKLTTSSYSKNLILKENDERIKILNTLKEFLPEDKCQIIDGIIKAFSVKSDIPSVPLPDNSINNTFQSNEVSRTENIYS